MNKMITNETKYIVIFLASVSIYFFLASLAIDYNVLGIFLMVVIITPLIYGKKIKEKIKEINLKIKEEKELN